MGCFIISRTPSGDRFLLQSEAGRTLASSRDYATLDACKKGICSLVYYAPIAPIVDRSAGEYGPNPKFEITADESGALYYNMKSANGKSVITDGPFATKKACLRAIAMLRTGVMNADVFFARPGGFDRLTVGGMVQDGEKAHAYDTLMPPAEIAEAQEESSPASVQEPALVEPAPAVKVPHRIRTIEQSPSTSKPHPEPTASRASKPPVSKSLFARLFKK